MHHLELERISRVKHRTTKDYTNIEKILDKYYNISTKEVDFFVFSIDVPYYILRLNKSSSRNDCLHDFIDHKFDYNTLLKINRYMNLGEDLKLSNFLYGKDLYLIRHHKAHAAYTYFTSPFKKSIIFTYDGIGYEDSPALTAIGENNKINKILYHHKYYLGFIYHTIANQFFYSYYGKTDGFSEGKLMALTSYGEPIYLKQIKKRFYIKSDPLKSIDMLNKFVTSFGGGSDLSFVDIEKLEKIHEIFYEEEIKLDKNYLPFYFANLSASWQKYFEELSVEAASLLKEVYKIDNICIGGGSGLNGLINYEISKIFKNTYIAPATSDCGIGLGCALYGRHVIADTPKIDYSNVAYIGLEHKIDTKLFKKYNLKYKKYSYTKLYDKVAELLSKGKIIGWYQGKSESGPRALGNRSILADPREAKMQEIINQKIKHREWFRPFAPAILREYVKDYFETDVEDKYMLKIAKVKIDKVNMFPAAIHVDNTARLQTVSKRDNLHFYNLIKSFYKKTGLPILLNTSFNGKGEPIVDSPEDAIKAYLNNKIDYLVCKNYLAERG